MTEKKKELLDDLFVDLGEIGEVSDQELSEEELDELTAPPPLTEEQKYSASVISLANFCKKDLTYILVPEVIDTDEGEKQVQLEAVELDDATTEEIVAWAKYVCPSLNMEGIPQLNIRKDKVMVFEMVVNYIEAIRRSWLAQTSIKR